MKIKSQRDFWSGLMFLGIGAAFAIGSLDYSFGNSARPGPAYFPFGLGVLMAILGGMVLFGALTKDTPDGDPVGAFAWRPLIIILASVALFGVLLPRLGMFITLPLLVVMSAPGQRRIHHQGRVAQRHGADPDVVGRVFQGPGPDHSAAADDLRRWRLRRN